MNNIEINAKMNIVEMNDIKTNNTELKNVCLLSLLLYV